MNEAMYSKSKPSLESCSGANAKAESTFENLLRQLETVTDAAYSDHQNLRSLLGRMDHFDMSYEQPMKDDELKSVGPSSHHFNRLGELIVSLERVNQRNSELIDRLRRMI